MQLKQQRSDQAEVLDVGSRIDLVGREGYVDWESQEDTVDWTLEKVGGTL